MKQKRNIEIILNGEQLDYTITSEDTFYDLATIIANITDRVCMEKGLKKSTAFKKIIAVIENHAKEKGYL